MVSWRTVPVTVGTVVSQWAETMRMALGLGSPGPKVLRNAWVGWASSRGSVGAPWDTNSTGWGRRAVAPSLLGTVIPSPAPLPWDRRLPCQTWDGATAARTVLLSGSGSS